MPFSLNQPTSDLRSIERFWRAANYVSAAMLYLNSNVLLKRPIDLRDFKPLITGHWGACPGINAIYAHTSDLIRRTRRPTRLIVGTGHAGPALLANVYLDGTLEKYYEKYSADETGLESLSRDFGVDGGFDTEISPEFPGMIYMGGELGAALAFAQGVAMNSRDSFTVCVIGDGELETSITQGSWQGFRFLSRDNDGAILPVVNANGYKMGSASLFGLMRPEQRIDYIRGLGLVPILANTDHSTIATAFEKAYTLLTSRNAGPNCQPVIILDTPKGWTAPLAFGSNSFAGSHKSHKPILKNPRGDREQARMIVDWLREYAPDELFDEAGRIRNEVTGCLPDEKLRLGNAHDITHQARRESRSLTAEIKEQGFPRANSSAVEEFFASMLSYDDQFLVFSPDEIESNQMVELIRRGGLKFGESIAGEVRMGPEGRVVEILNEHLCFTWAHGYAAAGRRSALISYEAFAPVFESLAAQYLKSLVRSQSLSWKPRTPSINIILTSLGWRNCATHQNPAFVDSLLARSLDSVRIYMPVDTISTKAFLSRMLESSDVLNVMVVSKHSLPRLWEAPVDERDRTASWQVLEGTPDPCHDLSLVSVGDCMAEECLHAKDMISRYLPDVSVQLIAIQEPGFLDRDISEKTEFFRQLDASVGAVWAYNGYPKTLQALLWQNNRTNRQTVVGFRDRTRSAPGLPRFIENGASRYHIALAGARHLQDAGRANCSEIIAQCDQDILKTEFN